jgi:tyrosine phenol-lyase
MDMPYAEPYKIKAVEMLEPSTREERSRYIEEAGYNLFNIASRHVRVDLLTDSGTGAMSDMQWAAIMTGDESYAGSRSFYELKESIESITGFEYVIPVHQGRAAENVLFSVLVKEGDIVPGNTHFDTTKGHIEFRKAHAVDCTIDEAFEISLDHPFKGNIDIQKLQALFQGPERSKIPFIVQTITCNSGGGQPVSLENIIQVHRLCQEFGVLHILDAARFAENAYFIKVREREYADWHIKDICREMFKHSDGMTMSSKKDGIVNIGGFIALKDRELYQKASTYTIMFEGYLTYGGMAGRDLAALARGLQESTEFSYLESRIRQVAYLGERLKEEGIPVLEPFGGHAVYIDALRFLPHIPQSQYPAQVLGIELYREAGVRGVEIGTVLADRDPETGKNRYPKMELLRLAIPRRVYTDNHLELVVWGLKELWAKRESLTGLRISYEAPILRHFTARFELCSTTCPDS